MSKQKEWQEAKRQVEAISDKLGVPVDKEIVEMVTILCLLKFNTVSSCGGHIRRVSSGPYVLLESRPAVKFAAAARETTAAAHIKRRRLRQKASRSTITEMKRLIGYLEDFYSVRAVDYRHQIVVQFLPTTLYVLKPHDVEAVLVSDLETRKQKVARNRVEMKAFTEYLKGRFFEKQLNQ